MRFISANRWRKPSKELPKLDKEVLLVVYSKILKNTRKQGFKTKIPPRKVVIGKLVEHSRFAHYNNEVIPHLEHYTKWEFNHFHDSIVTHWKYLPIIPKKFF